MVVLSRLLAISLWIDAELTQKLQIHGSRFDHAHSNHRFLYARMRRELVLDSVRAERVTPQPCPQTAKLKSSAMDLGSVLLTLVAGFILVFLYWLYSFAVAPFRVLSRLGIPGPPPVPFYGNQKMVVKLERLNFFTKMFEKYGNVFG